MNQDQRNVILTIREYENSVEMPDEERVTYLDPRGGVHLKEGDGLADRFQYVHWAERCAEYLRFGDEVDLATCGAYDRHSYLKICDTPLILLDAGFEQKPMLYTQKHLFQALRHKRGDDPHRHGLTVAQVKRFPELFESPVLLADNPSRDDAMLMVLRAVDSDKLPIITSIKPDGRGNYELQDIETNMVLTVFGKKNFARYFELALSPDMILYIDKERGQELERLSERPLFGDYSGLDLNTIIRRPQCLVNMETAGQDGYSLQSAEWDARSSSDALGKNGTSERVQDREGR